MAIAITPGGARAESWTLTRSDLKPQTVSLQDVDNAGVTVNAVGSTSQKVPWTDLVEMRRADSAVAPTSADAAWALRLTDGTVLAGKPIETTHGDELGWRSPSLGPLFAPLAQLAFITRTAAPDDLPLAATDDVVKMKNGDVIHGAVMGISNASVTIVNGDQTTSAAFDLIAAIRFANAGTSPATQPANSGDAAIRVNFADGSHITAAKPSFDGAEWCFNALGSMRQVAAGAVVSIAPIDGPVLWLSDLQPASIAYTPFLDERLRPTIGMGVGGPTTLVDGQPVGHLIGMHARAVVSWLVPAGYSAFRTQVAAAEGDTLTNAAVRVRGGDGRMLYAATIGPGAAGPIVVRNLDGCGTLTLEVDFPQTGFPAQARVNWIEPAFLRPAAAATSMPASRP